VHSLSAAEARVLFLMDADILFHRADTLWRMLSLLDTDSRANVAVDRPRKNLTLQSRKTLRHQLSLASAEITQAAEAQLCAQLYAIRAQIVRNIYLPRDLAACEDGFIKALVCTDSLTHEVWPERIKVAEGAEHIFEAYTSPAAILRNQKRQVIGQTIVHILVDKTLNFLPVEQRHSLAETIRHKEAADPLWLKRLIRDHLLEVRHSWRLYPDLMTYRFSQLHRVCGIKRFICYAAALAAFDATLIASWRAFRLLRAGCTNYWPKAQRIGIQSAQPPAPAAL
jgi:hypothetical protein